MDAWRDLGGLRTTARAELLRTLADVDLAPFAELRATLRARLPY